MDPASTDEAVADRRTRAQQLLDGILTGLTLAANTGALPVTAGLRPQLLISISAHDLARHGTAFLPCTGPAPAASLDTVFCDADTTESELDPDGRIINVHRTHRCYTTAQRRLLAARDKGCTFPDCTATIHRCGAHHIIPWQDGGETDVNQGALLCRHHHTLIHQGHRAVAMVTGIPTFTPSARLDPEPAPPAPTTTTTPHPATATGPGPGTGRHEPDGWSWVH